MAWFLVDIQLKVLIVNKEATTLLENGEMSVVLLSQHIQVITLCKLRFYFN
jgi:hypothetical protein